MRTGVVCLAVVLASCAVDLEAPDESVTEQELNGDSWATVDNDPNNNGAGARFTGVAISPITHTVVVVGIRYDDASQDQKWLVRTSANGASGFSFNSVWTLAPGHWANALNITVDSFGYFYVTGEASGADGKLHWIVRRSTNDAGTWTTVFDSIEPVDVTPSGITADSAGTIYIAGRYMDSLATYHGKIYRGTSHGTSWTQVYTLSSDTQREASLHDMCVGRFNGVPAVFAHGWFTANNELYQIAVESTDGGTNWGVAYTSGAHGQTHGYGCAGTETSDWVYFASGDAGPSPGTSRWDTLTFDWSPFSQTDDLVSGSTGFSTQARGEVVAADRAYSVGAVNDTADSNVSWRTRFTPDHGASWYDSDNFHFASATHSFASAYAAAYDTLRGLYVVGAVQDVNLREHGVVRRRN